MRPLFTLFSSMKIKLAMAAAIVGVFGLVAAPHANATPISFYNDASTTTDLRFTLGCGSSTGTCSNIEVLFASASPYSWSTSVGDMFSLGRSGLGTETDFVNLVTGESFDKDVDALQIHGSGNSHHFTTSAEYFLIKTGNGGGPPYALIHNLGGNLDLYFEAQTTGTGFSHFTTFGTSRVSVPEPAELGMLGFGLLLIGGFVGLRRRYH